MKFSVTLFWLDRLNSGESTVSVFEAKSSIAALRAALSGASKTAESFAVVVRKLEKTVRQK